VGDKPINAALPRHVVSAHAKNKTVYSCFLIDGRYAFNRQLFAEHPSLFIFTKYRKIPLLLIMQNAMKMGRKWLKHSYPRH
jgi:hypothetical protein